MKVAGFMKCRNYFPTGFAFSPVTPFFPSSFFFAPGALPRDLQHPASVSPHDEALWVL